MVCQTQGGAAAQTWTGRQATTSPSISPEVCAQDTVRGGEERCDAIVTPKPKEKKKAFAK